MNNHRLTATQTTILVLTCATAAIMPFDAAMAQQVVQSYSYNETNAMNPGGNDLIFGVAAFKICQIKQFLFMAVYVLAAIAFVIFAIKALFTKFEFKSFLPILGAIFVVAFADLFIEFMSGNQGWYCPTVLSTM